MVSSTENLRLQTLERFQVFRKIQKSNILFASTSDADLRDLQKKSRNKELRDHVKTCEQFLNDGAGKPVIFVIKKNPHALRGLQAIMEQLHSSGENTLH